MGIDINEFRLLYGSLMSIPANCAAQATRAVGFPRATRASLGFTVAPLALYLVY
ncbi:hypothetical protein AURDEDRAFT_178284 [Auricularia subglabra TFB-10046 SS5]|uniref:Uncharacterized protein n=1 Tax=Auricularia subglabra (strain TFB-10046 / SS5) TaxID=717982 RepID=J0L8F4_AURST|nr:hypothetical protein AURDEDRAFT_178284 [Auricularia subglabra TFB-10046 SS5]